MVGDPLYFAERAKLQTLLEPTRLPVAHGLRESVLGGGLLIYGADIAASHRYAATFVDKILRGARPADLPVEQPATFALVTRRSPISCSACASWAMSRAGTS